MRNKCTSFLGDKKEIYFLCIAYDALMVFYQLIPSFLTAAGSIIFVIILNYLFSRYERNDIRLFYMMIAFVPTSFVSVIGTSTAELPLSWFMLFTIILFFKAILTGKLNRTYLLLFITFALLACLTLPAVESIFDSCKQIFTISICLCAFFIGEYLKKYFSTVFAEKTNSLYIVSVIGFSVSIFFQRIYVQSTGNTIGHYSVMGAGRITYAGLMNDYSFATLYIATGAMLVLIMYFEDKKVRLSKFILLEVLFLVAMLVVNSRTGLFSFVLVAGLYLIQKFMSGNVKALLIGLVILLSLPFILGYITASRGDQLLLDSSGRIENYVDTIAVISENFLFGVGFGLKNLKNLTGLTVPHNYFIQYLVQCGIFGTILITLYFLVLFEKSVSKYNSSRWILYTILVGSMFIPDIFSSRYLSVIIILVITNSQKVKQGYYDIHRYIKFSQKKVRGS